MNHAKRLCCLEIVTPGDSAQRDIYLDGYNMPDSNHMVDEVKKELAYVIHEETSERNSGTHSIIYYQHNKDYCCFAAAGKHTHEESRGAWYKQIYIYKRNELKEDAFLNEIFGTELLYESDTLAIHKKELEGKDVCSSYRMVAQINRFDESDHDYYHVANAVLSLAEKKKVIVRLRKIKSTRAGEALEKDAWEFLLKLYSMLPVNSRPECSFCAFGDMKAVSDSSFDVFLYPSEKDVQMNLKESDNTVVINLDSNEKITVSDYLSKWFGLSNDERISESKKISSKSISEAIDEIKKIMNVQRDWWQKEEDIGTFDSLYKLFQKHKETKSLKNIENNTRFLKQIDFYLRPREDDSGFDGYMLELFREESFSGERDCINYYRSLFEKCNDPLVKRRFRMLEKYDEERKAKEAKEKELEGINQEYRNLRETYNKEKKEIEEGKNEMNENIDKLNNIINEMNENIDKLNNIIDETLKIKENYFSEEDSIIAQESSNIDNKNNDNFSERQTNNSKCSNNENQSETSEQRTFISKLSDIITSPRTLKWLLGFVITTLFALVIYLAISHMSLNNNIDSLRNSVDSLSERLYDIANPNIVINQNTEQPEFVIDTPASVYTDMPISTPTVTAEPTIMDERVDISGIWQRLSEQFSYSSAYKEVDLDTSFVATEYFTMSLNADEVRISLNKLLKANILDAVYLLNNIENQNSPSQILIINHASFDRLGMSVNVDEIFRDSLIKTRVSDYTICLFSAKDNNELISAFQEAISALKSPVI